MADKTCITPDCMAPATVDFGDGMVVCVACAYLMDHPEIDTPEAIEAVFVGFGLGDRPAAG